MFRGLCVCGICGAGLSLVSLGFLIALAPCGLLVNRMLISETLIEVLHHALWLQSWNPVECSREF